MNEDKSGAAFPHDAVELLGRLADKCDNLIAASKLPVPASMHVLGLTGGISSIKQDLNEIRTMLLAALQGGGK